MQNSIIKSFLLLFCTCVTLKHIIISFNVIKNVYFHDFLFGLVYLLKVYDLWSFLLPPNDCKCETNIFKQSKLFRGLFDYILIIK